MISPASNPSAFYQSSLLQRAGAASPNDNRAAPQNAPNKAESPHAVGKAETDAFANPQELTADEKRQVEELKRRDAEVRTHEMAHLAAAGSLAMGGPSYVFQTGPDGKQYAIGGSVNIDTSPGNTPEETLRKASQMRASALAPADPSPQDLQVAAKAAALEAQAQSETSETEETVSDPRQLLQHPEAAPATPFEAPTDPNRASPERPSADAASPLAPSGSVQRAAALYGRHA